MHEADILERAETYRKMARKAIDPRLRIEFTERAERYELVAHALRRGTKKTVNGPP